MFIKKIVLITTLFVTCNRALWAQAKVVNANNEVTVHQKVFRNALALQDAATALQACHYLVALQGDTSPYKDSMAILYYGMGSYQQALQLSLALYTKKANNTNLVSIIADSYAKLGSVKEAIPYQEKLYALQASAVNGFTLIELQMQMQRYAECIATATAVLSNKIDSNLVYYYKDTAGKQQQTPLKAAIYNYLGTAYYKQGNKAQAKAMLNNALAIDDKFLVAKLNNNALLAEEKK